ncbi:MAG: hypothetical protein LBG95_07815 [Treponema sp.]|jgi:hypothetical protein|nr:hypothetical protein [Treponema sp.]
MMALIKRIACKNIFMSALFVLISAVLCPAQSETSPLVLIRSSPEQPVAGSAWTLTLLIDHNEPDEVNVLAPNFTGSLFLDQVIKGPRFYNPATGQSYANQPASGENREFSQTIFERWTAMEYRFLLSGAGSVSFDAFTVVTPQGQTATAPFDLAVQQPLDTATVQNYRLGWENAPESVKTGETAIFSLRLGGWNSSASNALPPAELFLPPIPPGHILESIPFSIEEGSAGMALKLLFIPLDRGPLVLDGRRFSYNGSVFEIPALKISVSRASGIAADGKPEPEKNRAAAPFPPLETAARAYPGLYQKRLNECETIYASVKKIWENGELAQALAALRRNERDHPAGAIFALLRREAENSLGFTGANDEKKKLLPFFREKARFAVLRETSVRQIPDSAGTEITRFSEGQPVLLDKKTLPAAKKQHDWLRVITNDGNEISGWVPEENIIFY